MGTLTVCWVLRHGTKMNKSLPLTPPRPRDLGLVNWRGLGMLTTREISRFAKVHVQTLTAPVVTTLLYYAIFAVALGGAGRMIGSVPYLEFLAPGLIMMSMAQNAFANTSSSLVISKVQGNIVDVLMPPLSAMEIVLGYALGGLARGLVVGGASVAVLALFVALPFAHPFYAIYHAVMGSLMLALLGIVGGIWAEKFDQMAAVQNFIVMPATFLSGTFYSATQLPQVWQVVCHLNPFFYMIDGFRYGFTGGADGNLDVGVMALLGVNLFLFVVAYAMVARGYKLKS